MIYGYVRISTKKQSLERQIKNLKKFNSNILIFNEVFTGTKILERKVYSKLKKELKAGDILVFDSVSRMSRNADEGVKEYFELMEQGIELIFLKERYIDTSVYKEQIENNNNLNTDDKDLNNTIIKGIKEYLKLVAIKQIRIAFEQSEKEVQDLKIRTKEALLNKKAQGLILGRKKGSNIETKKAKIMKEKIIKLSKDFDGNLKDCEILELLKLARNTYYKYKREIKIK